MESTSLRVVMLCMAIMFMFYSPVLQCTSIELGRPLEIAFDTRFQLERMEKVLRGDSSVLVGGKSIKLSDRRRSPALSNLLEVVQSSSRFLDASINPNLPLKDVIEHIENPLFGVKTPDMIKLRDAISGVAAAAEIARRSVRAESDTEKIVKVLIGLALSTLGPIGDFLEASQPSEIDPRQGEVPPTRGPAVPSDRGGDRGNPGCCFDFDPPNPEGTILALVVMPERKVPGTAQLKSMSLSELEMRVQRARQVTK